MDLNYFRELVLKVYQEDKGLKVNVGRIQKSPNLAETIIHINVYMPDEMLYDITNISSYIKNLCVSSEDFKKNISDEYLISKMLDEIIRLQEKKLTSRN